MDTKGNDAPAHPTEGGSYVRDPATGALRLIEQTRPAPATGSAPAPAPAKEEEEQ
jgi:hypothetical protein